MLDKKIIKDILLEVEASCYNYERYLQEVIDIVLNDNNSDIKYIITRDYNYNCLCLYKYNENDFISWLYDNYDTGELKNNYFAIYEYCKQHYIEYYVEENILNFISIKKFRKELYNNKSLLREVINDIFTNVRNYANNEYLINEYNLNKKLYQELIKIERELEK